MSKKLVELIESIPKSARRYCHLQLRAFNPNSTENLYLIDFINIEKGKSSNLKSNQTRLYEKLLDILFQYYETDTNVSKNETRLIQRSFVLNKLGLQEEASRMSDKVIQLSLQNYNYVKCFEAFDQRLKFAFEKEDLEYLSKFVATDKDQKEKLIEKYLNLIDYQALWAIFKEEAMKKHFFNQEDNLSTEYKKLLSDEKNALTPEAKILFYKIKSFVCMKDKKYEEALDYMYKTKNIYNENEWLAKKDPLEHAKSVKNLGIVLAYLKEFDKIRALLNESEARVKYNEIKVENIELEVQCIYIGMETDLILHTGNYNIDEKIHLWEKILLNNFEKIPLEIRMNLAYKFFMINLHFKNYRKCKQFLNPILNFEGPLFRQDVREMALTGELTMHLLEGNLDLLDNRLRAMENFYLQNEYFFEFTPDCIALFKTALKDLSPKKLMPLLKEIFEKIKQGDWGAYVNYFSVFELQNY